MASGSGLKLRNWHRCDELEIFILLPLYCRNLHIQREVGFNVSDTYGSQTQKLTACRAVYMYLLLIPQ